jgi:predicted Rossmann fold nucleotide-binding protein DprA/Smf involved in DNA uptake
MLQDSYKKVQELILEIYEDLIKNGKNIEDIENTLKEKISVLLFKDFNNENKVKNEIQKKIEKNLTMRMLQDTFFPPNIQEHIKLQSNIQKNDTNI